MIAGVYMEFTSISDILKFAISKEQASIQFFRDLLPQITDTGVRSLLALLIKQEQAHIELLQLEMNKLGYTVAPNNKGAAVSCFGDEPLEVDDRIRSMTFVEMLRLAIRKERAAFQLYVQIFSMMDDEPLGKVLLELAEEEMRHVLLLEREYEAITHHEE
jgi:rubrerythrin